MKKKILVLLCNPKTTPDVEGVHEIGKLQRAMKRSQHFDFDWQAGVSKSNLLPLILDNEPQIIHFCGHGSNEGLTLHDENGMAELASNEYLANLLKDFNERIECVLLNACDSETLADEIVKHINYVIGMNAPVRNDAAIAFSEAFYCALGAGESIEFAFELGTSAVQRKVSSRNSQEIDRGVTEVDKDDNAIEQNQEHLIPVLKTNPNPTPIKPIWLSSEVERKAVERLLRAIQGFYNKIPLFSNTIEPIILQDQYIPVQVTLERQVQYTFETTRGYPESEAELKRAYGFKGSGEEDKRQRVSWQEARRQQSRIMVLADPGMGKTTLLQREVCTNIEQSYQALKDGQHLEEITIPLFIKLSMLADEITQMSIEDAILKIIQEQHSNILKNADVAENADVVTFLNDFLKQQLVNGKCLLLLDALDEVPYKNRSQLLKKLNNFAIAYSTCPIVGTSRIVGYGGKLVDGAKDMEIVPFNQRQTEQYIERFADAQKSLNDKTEMAKGLIQALRDRPQIGGLAQNPLLLSLICSLYQRDKLTLPARRWQIYQKSVNYMLSQWSLDDGKPGRDASDAKVATKTELLEKLAYQFSCEETEIFSVQKLRDKIKKYLRDDNTSDLNDKTNKLIDELSEDGILIKLNPEKDQKKQYLFLHRTFQEYFTASYLKHMIENDYNEGIECVKQYVWNYEWHETLTLLAGLMEKENSIMLIEAIASKKDDIFQTQLLLAGRCIAERSEISDPQIDEKLDRIYEFWLAYPDAKFIRSVVVAIAQTYTKLCQRIQTALADVDEDEDVKWNAAYALGEIGNALAVDALIAALKEDNDSYVKMNAASYALAEIGNDKAVNALIAALKENKDSRVRGGAAYALGEIGNALAVNALIVAALEDNHSNVRISAARALVKMGNDKAVDVLIAALEEDNDSEVKEDAARALGAIGNDKAVDALIAALEEDKDSLVKITVAYALAGIGNDKAVDVLIAVLEENKDSGVKKDAAYALGAIGNDKAVNALIVALKENKDSGVKGGAAYALGVIGNALAVDVLIAALEEDKDSFVKRNAARALVKIGNALAVNALIAALEEDKDSEVKIIVAYAIAVLEKDEDSLVKITVAKALAKIGNDKAVDALIAALEKDEDSFVKITVAYALAKIGNDKAVDVLIAVLLEDKDSTVKWSAKEALAKIDNAVCLEKLLQSAGIKIYRLDIFLLTRRLAIRSSKEGAPFIPVHPELVKKS